MRHTGVLAFTAAVLLVGVAGAARAELLELTNGQVLQGTVNAGWTTDEGLGLDLYDTGGTVVVKWDHIEESRRRQLRRETLGGPVESIVEKITGHTVLLVTGERVSGLALNAARGSEPLRIRTRSGVKEYDRSVLAGPVEETEIDGLLVYAPEELYQMILAADPPETAAAHKGLAERCIHIGAYIRAREHLLAARGDDVSEPDDKTIATRLRDVAKMIEFQDVAALLTQIRQAIAAGHFNDSLRLLNEIEALCKDEAVRRMIRFDLLEAGVVKSRDMHFRKHVQLGLYRTMDSLIAAKARERKPRDPQPQPAPGAAPVLGPGTLAAARQWLKQELDGLIRQRVATDLELTQDEIARYWDTRSGRTRRRAAYGSGSFIVVRRPAGAPVPRRPGSKPAAPAAADRPMTGEEWWDSVGPEDRRRWLTAEFVETSGRFEIVPTPAVNCDSCGGTGSGKDHRFCAQCNGCGVVRSVTYR